MANNSLLVSCSCIGIAGLNSKTNLRPRGKARGDATRQPGSTHGNPRFHRSQRRRVQFPCVFVYARLNNRPPKNAMNPLFISKISQGLENTKRRHIPQSATRMSKTPSSNSIFDDCMNLPTSRVRNIPRINEIQQDRLTSLKQHASNVEEDVSILKKKESKYYQSVLSCLDKRDVRRDDECFDDIMRHLRVLKDTERM